MIRSFISGTLTTALACALLFAGCRRGPAAEDRPPEDELWIGRDSFERGDTRVAEARTQPIFDPIAAGGRLAFDDQLVSHVFSPVTGRVTRVLAQLGEEVKKGSPLVAIVSPDVGSAVADEVKARADLTAARHDFERQKALFAEHAGSSRDFETSEDSYHKAAAEHERALQRLRLLRAGRIDGVTQEYTLPSPIAGRVVARTVNPGMEVQGQFSGGTAIELFTVGSTGTVWLFADLHEADLAQAQPGAAVAARVLAYPDRVFRGRVEWRSPTLDPALRTGRVRCSLDNAEGLLKPEMFASVLVERPSQPALSVPSAAVVRINDQAFLYVAAGARPDGKQIFKRRHVAISDRAGATKRKVARGSEVFVPVDGKELELLPVLSGIAEGEKVLIDHGPQRAGSDDDVSITRDQMARGKIAVVPVEERDVPDLLTVGGRLAFDDLRVSHVFSPVNGRIARVLAAPGERVKKGTPLAIISSADLGAAFADERKAHADLTASEHEVKRQREMYALRASAQKDLEVAEDNFARAQAEYQRAAQKTRLLREGAREAGSQEFVLRSPIEGEVIARLANPGVEVQGAYAGGGALVELFTIGSIDELWLFGDIYEADLPSVKQGAAVTLELPSQPGRVFHGTVDWISDTLDPVLRTAKVRCVLKNENGLLRPEMYQVVRIAAPTRRALTVPRDAVLRLGDETDVFVEQPHGPDGAVPFRRRRVLANEQQQGDHVPVLAGLKAGERVAAAGSIFLVGN
jgi:cobalt-zinc-cadmium efflux system membrane fusion protein